MYLSRYCVCVRVLRHPNVPNWHQFLHVPRSARSITLAQDHRCENPEQPLKNLSNGWSSLYTCMEVSCKDITWVCGTSQLMVGLLLLLDTLYDYCTTTTLPCGIGGQNMYSMYSARFFWMQRRWLTFMNLMNGQVYSITSDVYYLNLLLYMVTVTAGVSVRGYL